MATLTITYTPGITSDPLNSSPFICHRVCYRQGSSGPYCCLDDDTESIAGTPKTFDITINAVPCGAVPDVDPESCTNTLYEGYVQACCEDETSLSGRTPFSASFIADPTCVNKLVCCQSQRGLQDSFLVITDPGSGYDPLLSPLTVLIVRDPSDPVAPGGANDGSVEAIVGGGGTVTSLNTLAGGLYGITPLLVIPSPTNPGTTASAIAVIPCSDLAFQGDCNTSPQVVVDTEILLGDCANVCLPKEFPFIYSAADLSGFPDTTNFNYSPGGCCDCTTCRNYTVVTGSDQEFVNICYSQCTNNVVTAEQVCVNDFYPGSGAFNLDCVVPGSIYCTNDAGAILSITDNGDCSDC